MNELPLLPFRRSIGWYNGQIRFIDQRLLPNEFKIVETDDWECIADAIKTLGVRGAPLIGVAASLAVAATAFKVKDHDNISKICRAVINSLRMTRPTAYNLFWAMDRMERELSGDNDVGITKKKLIQTALDITNEDVDLCEAIGHAGQQVVPSNARILTVCNTGFLATAGEGTALSVVYKAADSGKDIHVTACETRPLLQGARLTAWELKEAAIPFRLVVDSAAAGCVSRGEIDLCIIGADRIAANGDTVNKIGSYQLALACSRHEIPFYVAAPYSTIDLGSNTGRDIEIELRSANEVTSIQGVSITPKDIQADNPAFDLVPHELISGIITDEGNKNPPYNFSN